MVMTQVDRSTEAKVTRGIPVAQVSAAAFAISSIWYALIVERVTQSPPPAVASGIPFDAVLERYYRWFATTLGQERIVAGVAIVGFSTLIVAVWQLRERLGVTNRIGAAGSLFVSLGSAVWIVGNILQLGGHRAVGLMATHDNPIASVNSISFTVDMIDDAFELVAFAMLGIGLLCLVIAGGRTLPPFRWWQRYTGIFALVVLALACAYAVGNGDVVNILLIAIGLVLTPTWLLWIARL